MSRYESGIGLKLRWWVVTAAMLALPLAACVTEIPIDNLGKFAKATKDATSSFTEVASGSPLDTLRTKALAAALDGKAIRLYAPRYRPATIETIRAEFNAKIPLDACPKLDEKVQAKLAALATFVRVRTKAALGRKPVIRTSPKKGRKARALANRWDNDIAPLSPKGLSLAKRLQTYAGSLEKLAAIPVGESARAAATSMTQAAASLLKLAATAFAGPLPAAIPTDTFVAPVANALSWFAGKYADRKKFEALRRVVVKADPGMPCIAVVLAWQAENLHALRVDVRRIELDTMKRRYNQLSRVPTRPVPYNAYRANARTVVIERRIALANEIVQHWVETRKLVGAKPRSVYLNFAVSHRALRKALQKKLTLGDLVEQVIEFGNVASDLAKAVKTEAQK